VRGSPAIATTIPRQATPDFGHSLSLVKKHVSSALVIRKTPHSCSPATACGREVGVYAVMQSTRRGSAAQHMCEQGQC